MKKTMMAMGLLLATSFASAATVATINGKDLDSSKIDSLVKLLKDSSPNSKVTDDDAKKMAFDNLVGATIINEEAKKRKLEDTKMFKDTWKEVEEEAKKQNAQKNPHYELIMYLDKTTLLQRLVEQDMFNKMKSDEQFAKKLFDEYKGRYNGTEVYMVDMIRLQKTDDVKKALLELAKKGAKFEDVKKKYTLDPNKEPMSEELSKVDVEEMDPKLADVLKSLKKGEHSKVAYDQKTPGANFKVIFKLNDIKKVDIPEFDKLKNEFMDQAKYLQTQIAMQELIANAKIEIKDKFYSDYTKLQSEMKKSLDEAKSKMR